MKKLLILAGAGPHCKVVESAKKMGIYTIVADYLNNSPAKLIADESLMCNITNVNYLTEYCKKNNVSGVLNFCIDPAQVPAQIVAEKCGLPSFGNKEQIISFTNKKAFKEFCRKCDVDIIPEYNEKQIDNDNILYPVIVKPVDSRGSRGCAICNNKQELILAIPFSKKESSDGNVIIEKYMENCQDLTISYLVKDGEPELVSVGDRFSGSKQDGLDKQLACTIQPSRYTKFYIDNVNNRVKSMIRTLGIQNGPVFMQGFVDVNTVRMYDPGIRFPGNEYERILEKATGIDLMKSLITYVVGGRVDTHNVNIVDCYDLNGKCAIQYMINLKEGEIAVFDGFQEISEHPNVIDIQQRYFIGDRIYNTGDILQRAGEISILIDRNIKKIEEVIEFIQSKLVINNIEGDNMIISPIDIKLIKRYYNSENYFNNF